MNHIEKKPIVWYPNANGGVDYDFNIFLLIVNLTKEKSNRTDCFNS